MSKFFIDRPIFAWVIALVIMLVGALSILKLPINQYPSIAPPAIAIAVTYPGASAQTVQDTVVQVIEQQLNGIDNLRYVSSESNSDGSMTITATFEQGTNPDTAQVQVQNKLNLATPLLPQEVQQQGIRVTKAVKNFLLVIGLVSEDGSMTKDDLANYIVSNMQDPISRTAGVGDFQVFGAQYAMRIWLDPAKLNKFQLTPVDVKTAVAAQNVQVSSGQLGGLPALPGTQLNATIIGKTRLQTAEQFEKILLKVNKDGSQVRLGDVAQVGLGGENYAVSAQFNGKPASGLAVKLATGANALDTASTARDHQKPRTVLPAWRESGIPVRHHPGGHRVDQRCDPHLDRGRGPGVPGDVPVPAELPRHHHHHHDRTGGVAGYVRHPCRRRLQYQHPDHVRHGPGHRLAGGRRHRRGGERRTGHVRGRVTAQGGDQTFDGTDPGAWWVLPWYCRRYCCPWRSSVVPQV